MSQKTRKNKKLTKTATKSATKTGDSLVAQALSVTQIPRVGQVPNSVRVRGIGTLGEAVATELQASQVQNNSATKAELAELIIADLADAGAVADLLKTRTTAVKTWVALVLDATAKPVVDEIEKFDQQLEELGVGAVDLVLLVDQTTAVAGLSAWSVVKAEAPASVLSRLPDTNGSVCRYVALTGEYISLSGNDSGFQDEPLSEDQLRFAMRDLVREQVDDIRSIRANIEQVVALGSPSEALERFTELDQALIELQRSSYREVESYLRRYITDGNELAVDTAANEETDLTARIKDVDLEQLKQNLNHALSEFLLIGSKTGLGKLFTKSKLKQSGGQLLDTTDAYIDGVASELIAELIQTAVPLSAGICDEVKQVELSKTTNKLIKLVEKYLVEPSPFAGRTGMVIDRAWTVGIPDPRHYLLASSHMVELLGSLVSELPKSNLQLVATEVDDQPGMLILKAQYALAKSFS